MTVLGRPPRAAATARRRLVVVTTHNAGDASAGARVASLLALGLERLLADQAPAAEADIVDFSPQLSVYVHHPDHGDEPTIEAYR